MNKTEIENKKDNNNINIIIRHTHPGVRITPEDGARIIREYSSNVAPVLTGVMQSLIEEHVAKGMSVDDVIECIHITGMAPRPSPQYLRAVMRNYGKGAKPAPSFSRWQNPALDYDQRSYEGLTFDDDTWMEAARKIMQERR